jgi:amino acid adenylation domain-containing protein
MSNIAKRIAELSPERRELLGRLLKQEQVDVARAVIMPRTRERDYCPLSFAQQRLWFLNQMEPDSPFYNIPDALYFNGALDIIALERSFGEIVRRHETLRTTFQIIDDEPVQVIAPPAPVSLDVINISHLPATEREAEAQRLADDEAQRPFDLSRGPLLRLRLLKLDAEKHVLLITMHHIISDGWSLDVLKRELSTLYAAFGEGKNSPLAELAVQYADFSVWQHEWLSGEVLDEQLGYWREQLGGGLPVLELPTDRPRPAVQTYRGALEASTIDERLTSRLKEIGRDAGATLFMTLLAAFNILLSRYSGQEEIVVGSPIAGRNRGETEELIGFFVNTLVLRTRLREGLSFRELLEQVRETTLGAYAHQDVPFEKLVEELQPERQTSHTPLFQVVFTVQNFQSEQLNLGGTDGDIMQTETGTAKFDLRLAVAEEDRTLTFSMRYSTDLFDAARIRGMLNHFQNLLAAIAVNPDCRISELPLLSERERQQLQSWNATRVDYPGGEKQLHSLFEAQAERTPDRVALVFESEQLNYAELNARANQLAHHLRRMGVGADALVAICVERSIEMVVGLLGILKAGGAYVPVDPTYPPERVAFMLEDCRAQVLLTQERLLASLPRSQARAFCLDTDWKKLKGESTANPNLNVAGENLAYMIYTSGSTGRPKGSMNTHTGICNRILWMQQAYGLDKSDRVLLKTPFSFDVSVWEFFWPLLTGARLVIARPGGHQDSAYLVETIAREQVTTLHFVPSMLQVFLEERELAHCSSLRRVICSGEALPHQLQERFFARLDAELHNLYGPTEAAVDVSSWRCVRDRSRTAVPIGRPIANTEIYLLDRHLNQLPVGVAGELHIGGVALSRGYFGRADLTAERFIPHPFSKTPGARLYRTGDRAIRLPGGEIVFLGRLDQQVKIRGFRIEPGEIEAALAGHPAVLECIVVVREDQPGDRRLTAYLVSAPDKPSPNVEELRSFLRVKLPEHMIPAAFVSMDKLPLTVNGKIDRRALPPPGHSRPALARSYVAPRDVLEALLVEMWRELLRIERVGVEDDFFALGADSIQGAVFINRLQEKLGEIVHVITIFRFPTIAALAAYLKEQYAEAVRSLAGPPTFTETWDASADAASITRQPATTSSNVNASPVDAAKIARLRRLVKPLLPRAVAEPNGTHAATDKNPPAVFVLSPPRSGSTLFRVMLAGHPALFAPPELELLSFNTLAERRENFSGSQSFWLEGTIRAVMEIRNCGAEEAKALMQDWERRGLTTKECYRVLQDWIGEKHLVDKTPSYALDKSILRRAEADFHDALYIHLLRHPFGMIRSFEEARLEQIFFRHEHGFTRRELAELIWLVSNENILEFLRSVPQERQHRVRFEELLERPEEALRGVCRFLKLEFADDMLQPYRNKEQRMTDGIHAQSRMLGDVKFHRHSGIDARVGNRWRTQSLEDSLSEETWRVAEMCGYEREAAGEKKTNSATPQRRATPTPRLADDDGAIAAQARVPSPLVAMQPHGERPPLFCVHPAGGNVACYSALSRHLGFEQPFYGLRAALLDGGSASVARLEEMAAHYVEAVRSVQPAGPYMLGGWSMGGVVAFEMAQQLQRQGQTVSLLVLIDSHALDDAARAVDQSEEALLHQFTWYIGRLFGMEEWLMREDLDESGGIDGLLRSLLAEGVRIGAVPPDLGMEQVKQLFQVFRTNVRAMLNYEPKPYPGSITLLRASQQLTDHSPPAANGWQGLAAGGVEVHPVSGDHFTMMKEPHVQIMAGWLKRCLDRSAVIT